MGDYKISVNLDDDPEKQRRDMREGLEAAFEGGLLCPCPCHKTIEQGGGDFANRDCIHCRVIGVPGGEDG